MDYHRHTTSDTTRVNTEVTSIKSLGLGNWTSFQALCFIRIRLRTPELVLEARHVSEGSDPRRWLAGLFFFLLQWPFERIADGTEWISCFSVVFIGKSYTSLAHTAYIFALRCQLSTWKRSCPSVTRISEINQ